MCGRFTLNIDADFSSRYQLSSLPQLAPKYQAYPGAIVPVIINQDSTNVAELKTWGMGAYKSFNARAETLLEKPTFSKSFFDSRCLVPVNGFFEAKKFFTLKDQYLFSLAGIFHDQEFAVITLPANETILPYHHRMPLILPKNQESFWLKSSAESVASMLSPTRNLTNIVIG